MRKRSYKTVRNPCSTPHGKQMGHVTHYDEILKVTKRIDARKLAITMEQRVRKAEKEYAISKAALERAMTI